MAISVKEVRFTCARHAISTGYGHLLRGSLLLHTSIAEYVDTASPVHTACQHPAPPPSLLSCGLGPRRTQPQLQPQSWSDRRTRPRRCCLFAWQMHTVTTANAVLKGRYAQSRHACCTAQGMVGDTHQERRLAAAHLLPRPVHDASVHPKWRQTARAQACCCPEPTHHHAIVHPVYTCILLLLPLPPAPLRGRLLGRDRLGRCGLAAQDGVPHAVVEGLLQVLHLMGTCTCR